MTGIYSCDTLIGMKAILIKQNDRANKRVEFSSFPEMLEKTGFSQKFITEYSSIDKRSIRRWAAGGKIPEAIRPLFTCAIWSFQEEKWYPDMRLALLKTTIDGEEFNAKTGRAGHIGKKRTYHIYMDQTQYLHLTKSE